MEGFLRFIGRICFAAIFIFAGASKIPNIAALVTQMTSEGIPYANYLVMAAIVVELGAGLMILFGWKTRFAALLIILFTIPVTYFYHDFWTFAGAEAQGQMMHFLKNLAIVGGACFIMASGAGVCSFDRRKQKKKAQKTEETIAEKAEADVAK